MAVKAMMLIVEAILWTLFFPFFSFVSTPYKLAVWHLLSLTLHYAPTNLTTNSATRSQPPEANTERAPSVLKLLKSVVAFRHAK